MLLLQFHVAVSLIGIATGLIVLLGFLNGRVAAGWTSAFLVSTILTSVTGFPLPPFGFDPPRAVGILSLVLLVVAAAALYLFQLRGMWRLIFVGTATAALYLNVFVAVVQAFTKIPALQALAPTQSEPPFVVAQLVVLVIFIALGIVASLRSRKAAPGP